MTKALILAAGRGTRLGELTKNQPKPTIQIGGKTVIERIIENLHIAGITEIIVNLHYLPTMITEKVASNALFYYEPILLGHDGTIKALRKWLQDDEFFVCNGDTVSNPDYQTMMDFSRNRPTSIICLMDSWRAAGTWLYPRGYFQGRISSITPFRQRNLIWHDIGTPERLEEARKYYEQ